MNREFLPEAVAGITIALLLAVFAAYRTAKPPTPGVMRRAAMVAILIYALIAAQSLVRSGLTWWGVLLLLFLMWLAVAGWLAGSRRAPVDGPAADTARHAVSVGLMAAMLIAAGQTLSMIGQVDPRMVVIAIAVVAALLVGGQQLAASGRISSLAVWLLIIPIVLSLALGVLLGEPGQAINPIIEVPGIGWAQMLGLIVAFVALGWADPGLAATNQGERDFPVRVLIGAGAVVTLICLGLLMFFGGAIIAPSVQFFVVPANLDALPGLAGVIIAVLAVLFIALVATPLSGALHLGGQSTWLVLTAGAAALLALINPGMDWIVVATSLVAATVVAARSDRGTTVGLVVAVIAIAVLTFSDHMTLGWQSAVAALVAGAAAAIPAAAESRAPSVPR